MGKLARGPNNTYPKFILGTGTASVNTAPLKFRTGTNLTTPESGAMEFDGKVFYLTKTANRRKISISNDAVTSSTTVANSVVETTIFTANIAANGASVGDVFRFKCHGHYSTANSSDTFTVRFKVGATTILSYTSTAANVTNSPWHSMFTATVRTLGASGLL